MPQAYDALLAAERPAFAWEWLRRSDAYRAAWTAFGPGGIGPSPQAFGLERFEDPSLGIPVARPVWTAAVAGDVLQARVSDPTANRQERLDLRLLSHLVTVAIGDDEIEHLLLSDGHHSIRIDVLMGTLIGCPAALTYMLHGISGLKGPMVMLERLACLVMTGTFRTERDIPAQRRQRWINELRVADALEAGANQQMIARSLFGPSVGERRWRLESASYRSRVQRLVFVARETRADPLSRWFSSRSIELR
jgi:hypothetical protein